MQAVRQVFKWATIDGRPFVSIDTWVSSLSEQEQQKFSAADIRQKQHRQAAIDAGLMIRNNEGDYIWRDKSAADQGKGTDAEWYDFFQRWIRECGIVFNTEFKEE